jgi:hypothetical protein
MGALRPRMPLCFIEPQDAIRVIAESVGRETRRHWAWRCSRVPERTTIAGAGSKAARAAVACGVSQSANSAHRALDRALATGAPAPRRAAHVHVGPRPALDDRALDDRARGGQRPAGRDELLAHATAVAPMADLEQPAARLAAGQRDEEHQQRPVIVRAHASASATSGVRAAMYSNSPLSSADRARGWIRRHLAP